MGDIAALRRADVGIVPASLEEKLVWLTRFGQPVLRNMGSGWYAGIEMHVSSKGATFKVDSDFKHETPVSAIDQCIERMLQTLVDLGAKP